MALKPSLKVVILAMVVCFELQNAHSPRRFSCPLCANSGHDVCSLHLFDVRQYPSPVEVRFGRPVEAEVGKPRLAVAAERRAVRNGRHLPQHAGASCFQQS
jgi:hypothetical protein